MPGGSPEWKRKAKLEGWWPSMIEMKGVVERSLGYQGGVAWRVVFRAVGLGNRGDGVPNMAGSAERLLAIIEEERRLRGQGGTLTEGSFSIDGDVEDTRESTTTPCVTPAPSPVALPAASVSRSTVVEGDPWAGKKYVSEVEVVRWVADNLYRNPQPKEAPSATAWGVLVTYRGNEQARLAFYANMWSKLLPTKADIEAELRRRDDGRELLELEDRLVAASGAGLLEAGSEVVGGEPEISQGDAGAGGVGPGDGGDAVDRVQS